MHVPRRLRLSGESYREQRVIGIDWRGSAESDQLPPRPDLANYSMRQHARDMLAALDELRIDFCRLATRSTGDIIGARMLLKQPQRFGRVFAPDPVTPLGWSIDAEQIGLSLDNNESRGHARSHGNNCLISIRSSIPHLVL
jgi:pimeloyl-ACP methyl ester carboxylesterase